MSIAADIIWWVVLPVLGAVLIGIAVRARTRNPRDHWWLQHEGATDTSPLVVELPTKTTADREFEEIARAALAERKAFLAFAEAEFTAIDQALANFTKSTAQALAQAGRWHARNFAHCEHCHHNIGVKRTVPMLRDWRIDTPTGEHRIITPKAVATAVLVS